MTEEKKTLDLEVNKPTYSQRFTAMVVREFSGTIGKKLELSPYQMVLAQHLFIGIDKALTDLEAKRLKEGREGLPIVWANINMQKLSLDAVHRIELGLDALIPAHIYPIPYYNGKLQKYDLDLQIGYVGKDYYKRKMAITPPVDIIYQLVHKTDVFVPKMKRTHDDIESYEFDIKQPFDRGEVVGGFGYVMYEEPTMNRLVIVPKASFDKSKKLAKSQTFWGPHPEEMQMVCLVRRVTATIKIDPEKVNGSFAAVEMDDAEREIQENANAGPVIDIEAEPEREAEPEKEEAKADPVHIPTGAANGQQQRVPGF
jgi:recombination protein RecT